MSITFAHLPAGYIACSLLYAKFEQRISSYKAYLFWGLLGSVAPDLDYYYKEMFDPSENPSHHHYFTHYPFFWLILWVLSLLWLGLNRRGQGPVSAFVFSLGGIIHNFLDTVVGRIYWFAPFSFEKYGIVSLVRNYDPSMLPDFWNWGYGVELIITLWAVYLWSRSGRRRGSRRSAGL